MKHLISLSLKYIRRQKLKSLLTFLCITLSVFILCTMSTYYSSITTTIKNMLIAQNGGWEADLSDLITTLENEKIISSDEAIDIITNHAVVSDSACTKSVMLTGDPRRDENYRVSYFKVEFSDGFTYNTDFLYSNEVTITDVTLFDQWNRSSLYSPKPGEIFLPSHFKDYGYDIGDTITFSITPATGVLTNDSPQVQDTIERYEEKHKGSQFYNPINLDKNQNDETGEKMHLMMAMAEFYAFNDIEFTDEIRGVTSETVTYKIAGFNQMIGNKFGYQCYPGESLDIMTLLKNNPEMLANASLQPPWSNVLIRLNDNVDFDDSLDTLMMELGVAEGDLSLYSADITTNDELLAVELKGMYAISGLLPLILLGFILIFLGWSIARFVIDNTFEMSVKERSAQFATLRIMGASKNQLVALVLTEAIFYTITALPLGLFTAIGICKFVMTSLGKLGVPYFGFSAHPIIIAISVILCIAGILISAYTSAIWASRKLSPAEALNFGKPSEKKKKRRRKERKNKSVINKSSKGFILRYTMKNISRTKSRFVISTITMTLGVLMFTVCVLLGIYAKKEVDENLPEDYRSFDFYTYSYGDTPYSDIKEVLSNEKLFSDYRISISKSEVFDNKHTSDVMCDFTPYGATNWMSTFTPYRSIEQNDYDQFILPITGFSYEEFVASKSALVIAERYGYYSFSQYDENVNLIPYCDKGYKSYSDLGYSEAPVIELNDGEQVTLAGAVYVDHKECQNQFFEASIVFPVENTDIFVSDNSYAYSMNVYATVNGKENYNEALAEFDAMCNSISSHEPMTNNYMSNTGLREFIKTILIAVISFILSIWLVGILSMVNSINTSVLNRQPELIMMRSVGMTSRQLLGTVVIESILFSLISTILGTLLGTAGIGLYIRLVLHEETFNVIPPAVFTVVISLALNLFIAFLASLPGIRNLKKCFKQYRT